VAIRLADRIRRIERMTRRNRPFDPHAAEAAENAAREEMARVARMDVTFRGLVDKLAPTYGHAASFTGVLRAFLRKWKKR
jgi:hypothetical protein